MPFSVSVKDLIIGEFNHDIQIDVVSLSHGNVLHEINVGTGFQNGGFVKKMEANSARKLHRKCSIDVYAGAPNCITTDAETNCNF